MILDCCFAGAIRNTMGSTDIELKAHLNNFVQETQRSARGVVQVCAAGKDYTASALDETASYTMFTGAMLHVLQTGIKELGPRLSLFDLTDGARRYIREQFPSQAVDPVASVSEAIGGESFAAQPIFINNAYRGQAVRASAPSQVKATGPAGRRKALSLNISWRDWFSKSEIRLAAALSQWFRTSEEVCEQTFAKCISEQGSKRDWLVTSRVRLYFVVDRPNLIEPSVEWSYPINFDENSNPRIKVALLSSNVNGYVLNVGESRLTLSREFFRSGNPAGEIRDWVIDAGKSPAPSAGQIQTAKTEIEILKRLREFADNQNGELGADIVNALREDFSDDAALWAMELVRMRRRDPRLRKKDSEHLSPILDCLCSRKGDIHRHRYFSQVAYLLWCERPEDEERRVGFLDRAIKLRDHSPDKRKFERYEVTRAVSKILSDVDFSAKRPSGDKLAKSIVKDLSTAKALIERDDVSEDDGKLIRKWAALNKSALEAGDSDLCRKLRSAKAGNAGRAK
jgi:hypothetical protein